MEAPIPKNKRPIPQDSGFLPEPTISFTIPSLHHDTHLECRIYHPKQFSTSIASCPETKAAIIAHPYTPMGGCFDDHVLHAAGLEFLHQVYILGLFNLRGAGASQGHTSWSSKPEMLDYCSFVGFLRWYMLGLQGGCAKQSIHDSDLAGVDGFQGQCKKPVLVLGGYSYGSSLVRQLPDVATILNPFTNPNAGTAAAEIKLRAMHLAQEYIYKQQTLNSKSRAFTAEQCHDSPIYGGDESQPGTRRISHQPRHSFEIVKKSVEKTRAHFSKQHRDVCGDHESEEKTSTIGGLQTPEIRYLLISPLLPPVSALLALSSHWWKADPAVEERLRNHQSFAVWGSGDFFTSSKKLKNWAEALRAAIGSQFEYAEFPGIGHFWLEADAEVDLRQAVRLWIERCDDN